jgi:group I intron endonuclease
MSATVYAITHRDTGREYVGATSRKVEVRWSAHVSASRQPIKERDNSTRMRIVCALREHGAEAFDFEVLATLPTFEEAKLAERIAIATRAPAFNACSGTPGDHVRTLETRAKVSAANARAWAEGRRSRTASLETRAKMSAARIGRHHDATTCALIGQANSRRLVTDETRAKMSAARRGVKHGPMSEATKAKIAARALERSAARKTRA